MPEPGTQGFNCVKNKIAAYKKKTGRHPNQSIIGQYQTECYQAASREKNLEKLTIQATEEAKKKNQRY